MIALGLITCIVLRALSAQAKVVPNFNECRHFFYEGIEPSGMDQNAKKICQKLEYRGFYYASLYSVYHRIPLYSAYTLDPYCSRATGSLKDWRLEPQVSQPQSPIDYMVRENQNNQNLYKGSQATSRDYSGTGYDRGHLNPNFFQCGLGRNATFTLTNAAPMIRRFNQKHWKNWESTLRRYLLQKLVRDGGTATAFIVTGTVPDPSVRIPQRDISDDPERVTVPSHIWTAVCYKHHNDDTKSLSFGYIGKNHPEEPNIRLMSVSDLNNELSGTQRSIKIFNDQCFGDNNKLNKVIEVFQKLINLLADQTSSDKRRAVKRTFSSDTPGKRVRVNENTGKMSFDSMSTYYSLAEDLKVFAESACPITYARSLVNVHDELRKREVSTGPDVVECQLIPEQQNTLADGSQCSHVSESDDSCRCKTGGKTKLCCSSPCLYQDDLNGYKCYYDRTLIDCSPPYSLITHNGKKCLDDHPCAKYDEDYYWCKTSRGIIKDGWDYCSPPLRNTKTKNGQYCRSNHACANYGYRYTWCYTNNEGNWGYC